MTQLTIDNAFDLAQQHHRAGRLGEAEQLYRQILAQRPEHSGAMHYLGVIASQAGLNGIAVDLIRRAIALGANSAEAHSNLGNALQAEGQFDAAIAAGRQAIALGPHDADAHNNLGNALAGKGEQDQAIAAYRQALALRPNFPEAQNNLGNALAGKGNLDQAIAAYREALALRPNYAEAHNNLGVALRERGQLDEAIAAYRRAIILQPSYAEAHNNIGVALTDQGCADQAIAACRQAIALRHNYAEAHSNLGNALTEERQFDEAIASYRRAIALSADFAPAHLHLALVLLSRGDFREGCMEYEWRSKCTRPPSARKFAQPRWDGSPLEGRAILLDAEQGIGDTIQFIRYLPMVAQRGGKIIVECQGELERLMRTMDERCQVVAQDHVLPAFDFHCPLPSLPLIFGTTSASLPNAVPYLSADARDATKWRHLLADHSEVVKVGLAWAGGRANTHDRKRSISLATLAPLGQIPGVRFFSLQKGDAAAQARTAPTGIDLVDWTTDLKDFADTAALIANLDLVITVDTAVAHLAGALGKPVWTLLPFVPDWRWLLDREDSPWYPSMRLFRQPSRGDWGSVVKRVVSALPDLIVKGTAHASSI